MKTSPHKTIASISVLLLGCVYSLIGCGPEKTTPRTGTQSGGDAPIIIANPSVRQAPLQNRHVRAAVLPMGAIPYDMQTIPLVSPDGRWIATQTGVTPNWDTVLARPEAAVPYATRIEIYRLGWGEQQPVLVHALSEPLILGRSIDSQGFLVESVREDGARWIGKASWTTGEIEWLVQGDEVNAFASLGPVGQLAWCRRAIDEQQFHLVVRTTTGEWSHELPSGDWLMPTWAERRDAVFVLSLQNGFLDAVFANATSDVAFTQSMRRLPLATAAYDRVAYQTTVVSAGQQASGDSMVFWHPFKKRIAIWQPYVSPGNVAVLSREKSFAGILDQDGSMLVVAEGERTPELFRHELGRPLDSTSLIAGLAIPRSVRRGEWSFVLLAPNASGMVGLTGMQLLPADEDD